MRLRLLALFVLLGCSASGSEDVGGTPSTGDDIGITDNDGSSTDSTVDDSDTGVVDSTPPPEDTRPVEDSAPPEEAGEGGVIIPGCGLDSDGDGISDIIEGKGAPGGDVDTDKDGIPDYLDLDSDNDGIPDVVEWVTPGCASPIDDKNDADGDGIPNFQDLDSDGNGLPDKDEACPPSDMLAKLSFPPCVPGKPYDFDSDGVPDYLDFDNDHDSSNADKAIGLSDKIELSDDTGKYVGLIDSDGDGIPDVYDRDSDNDFILDLDDGVTDPDGDGKPAFRDTDSDGDGVPDSCEARGKAAPSASDYTLPLKDSDGDGAFDYLDRDSDGDLLADGLEDKNGNCIVDADETDRLKGDTDGDGVGDLVEVTLIGAAGAKDATKTPEKAGKFYFLEPYSMDGSAKPTPTTSPLALNTDLKKGDLGIVVDSTFSMDPEFNNLKTNLGSIIDTLKTKLPDLGVGIAGHDDYPTSKYSAACFIAPTSNLFGSCDTTCFTGITIVDDPYYQLIAVTADKTAATTAVKGLRVANGSDLPEDQVTALHYAFTGATFSWPSYNGCAAGSRPAVADTATNYGALRFRSDALPILMELSDSAFHNGQAKTAPIPSGSACLYRPTETTCTNATYSVVANYPFAAPSISALATALKAKGARFIGAAADDARAAKVGTVTYVSGPAAGPKAGVTSAARNANWQFGPFGDMEYLVDQTASYVDPADFTHTAACPVGQCCTGFNGAGVAPDAPGGKCKLVFNVNHDGTGLNTSIVDSVIALLNAIRFDVHVQAIPAAGPVDSVDTFIEKVEPSPTGGKDPVTGDLCVTFPATSVADRYKTPKAIAGAGDISETILSIAPGSKYCFNVVPKPNTTVKPTTSPQLFTATLRVLAENAGTTITLGSDRDVLFIVPPVLN